MTSRLCQVVYSVYFVRVHVSTKLVVSILKMLSIFSGSSSPHGPDLPWPFGRKFHFALLVNRMVTAIIAGGGN